MREIWGESPSPRAEKSIFYSLRTEKRSFQILGPLRTRLEKEVKDFTNAGTKRDLLFSTRKPLQNTHHHTHHQREINEHSCTKKHHKWLKITWIKILFNEHTKRVSTILPSLEGDIVWDIPVLAKVLTRTRKFDHISLILLRLNWLLNFLLTRKLRTRIPLKNEFLTMKLSTHSDLKVRTICLFPRIMKARPRSSGMPYQLLFGPGWNLVRLLAIHFFLLGEGCKAGRWWANWDAGAVAHQVFHWLRFVDGGVEVRFLSLRVNLRRTGSRFESWFLHWSLSPAEGVLPLVH